MYSPLSLTTLLSLLATTPPLLTSATAAAHPPFHDSLNTTYLFTATVLLGKPPTDPNTDPVTVPGGVIVPEPILGGTISGPYLNANITSGLATPRVYRNGTLQEPVINLYGITDSGAPLVLFETGIGSPEEQVTRLEVSIGGGERYDLFNTGFILATVNPNEERTEVAVRGYLVENIFGV